MARGQPPPATATTIVAAAPADDADHPLQASLRQGEIGDLFYIIESGQVEIVREEPGEPPKRLGIRNAGTSFGEIALLKEVPRMATVQCPTPVDVDGNHLY